MHKKYASIVKRMTIILHKRELFIWHKTHAIDHREFNCFY